MRFFQGLRFIQSKRCSELSRFDFSTRVAPRLVVILFTLHQMVAAPDPSPELIERLERLPYAQQQALARQYGVDLGTLEVLKTGPNSSFDSSAVGSSESESPLVPIKTIIVSDDEGGLEEGRIKRYGRHIFDQQVSTFAPVDNAPVPEGYLLGPGDTLNVTLYGNEQLQRVLRVSREGVINFPRLGTIILTGLSFNEAKQTIENRVSRQMIGTEVVVSMGRLRSINVFLAGEVRTPGSYAISALSTLTQALYVAGGVTDIGSLRNIEVRQRGKITSIFDVYELLLNGDSTGDVRLSSGDVVFVPTLKESVTIIGAIRRPASYELKGGETVDQLIRMAGGITDRGFERSARLTRYVRGSSLPQLLEIDLIGPEGGGISLISGDRIEIDEVSDRPKNAVTIRGAFARPGFYAWKPGIRLSYFLEDVDADLYVNTDLESAIIVRRRNQKLRVDVQSFRPFEVLYQPGSEGDPVLEAFDEVLFFPLVDVAKESDDKDERLIDLVEDYEDASVDNELFVGTRSILLRPVIEQLKRQASLDEQAAVVGIDGAVRIPGEYPLLEDKRITRLIALAGGLRDDAFVESVEIRRIESKSGESARVRILDVDLRGKPESLGDSIELQSRDFVRVNSVPNWSPSDSVTVRGEAVFPGKYLISPGETLSSVIKRAGGLTDNGFPQGAFFTRESVKRAEDKRLRDLSKAIARERAVRTITSEAEESSMPLVKFEEANSDDLTESLFNIETDGRLVINLLGVIAGVILEDIEVQDGDILDIPPSSNAVTVVGEVHKPGSFRYRESLMSNDYIDMAGGLTSRSDKKNVYVVKANGSVWHPNNLGKGGSFFRKISRTDIQSGDTVVIPLNQNFKPVLSRYREITTVVFQSIASIAAILSL